MDSRDLAKRKRFLAGLESRRGGGCRIRHYTEVLDSIEPAILPLVRSLDGPLTTPIFSCQGHWEARREPNVMFVPLPGKERLFRKFASYLIDTAPDDCIGMELSSRLRPKRFGNGPFIDWRISIDVPFGSIRSARAYERAIGSEIRKYADLISARMRSFERRRRR